MSEIKFNAFNGGYGFYNKEETAQKPVEEEKSQVVQNNTQNVAPDKVLDAMNLLGAQNISQISGKIQTNPANFLSEERISDIEKSMALFEQGVEKYAGSIKEEFGNVLGEKTVYALAAEAFSLNA